MPISTPLFATLIASCHVSRRSAQARDEDGDDAKAGPGESPGVPPEAQDLTLFVQNILEQMVNQLPRSPIFFPPSRSSC